MSMKYDTKIECRACKATGLYVGMGEAKGSAVVCHTCQGTGCEHLRLEYKVFVKRQERTDIKKVFAVNVGIVLGPTVKGGMRYEDWLNRHPHYASLTGAFPKGHEDRDNTCPLWYYQSADSARSPQWSYCDGFNGFAKCKYFPAKERCWARFDKDGL